MFDVYLFVVRRIRPLWMRRSLFGRMVMMVSKEHIITSPMSKAGLEKSLLRPKAALQMDPIRDKRIPLLDELMRMTRCVFGCEFFS
jgi:hypothetical protein